MSHLSLRGVTLGNLSRQVSTFSAPGVKSIFFSRLHVLPLGLLDLKDKKNSELTLAAFFFVDEES